MEALQEGTLEKEDDREKGFRILTLIPLVGEITLWGDSNWCLHIAYNIWVSKSLVYGVGPNDIILVLPCSLI